MNFRIFATLSLLLLFCPNDGLAGELKVARIFADHGVLQQGVAVPVWGTAGAQAEVVVRFAGQTQSVTSGEDGKWMLKLDPLKAQSAGNRMIVKSGEDALEIRDLVVGEVWYASGQSNMEMSMAACAKHIEFVHEVIAEPKSRLIRTMRIGNPDSPGQLDEFPGPISWKLDTPINRPEQSAAAYFFARELHDELEVPVGIIEGSWGGKPIEGFIPREQFTKNAGLATILELSDADELEELAKIEGGVIIRNTAGRPGRIFNSRIAPLAPYALKGFIWYQGESNAGAGEDPRNYRAKMQALVGGWRSAWQQDELPCYFVQLPSFNDSAGGWVRLREEQRLSLQIPWTGMAVAIDLRDSDIHPANKVDVGKRLSSWALAKTYGKTLPFSGPLFRSIHIENHRIRVDFEHVGEGLIVARKEGLADPVELKGAPLAHFEVADDTGKWHAAEAMIEGATVVVQSDAVGKPVAVRYACEGDPERANLYNRAGFPASPFCSKLEFLPWGR